MKDSEDERSRCYVYQVVNRPVGALKDPALGNWDDTAGPVFAPGDLVSVDMKHDDLQQQRSFFRLSDGRGWIPDRIACGGGGGGGGGGSEQDKQKQLKARSLRQHPVESGQWSFYVATEIPPLCDDDDNENDGSSGLLPLLRHPTADRDDLVLKTPHGRRVSLQPMERVSCDGKVTHFGSKVNYYRVQGTECWIADRKDDVVLLLEERKVKIGSFAYCCLEDTVVVWEDVYCTKKRWNADTTDGMFKKGDIAFVDMIRGPPFWMGGVSKGPYLRLADGSGWIVQCSSYDKLMEQVNVQNGSFDVRVLADMSPGDHWTQPRKDYLLSSNNAYKRDDRITCDQKVVTPVGVTWYRVKGKSVWLLDAGPQNGPRQCGASVMLADDRASPLDASLSDQVHQSSSAEQWTVGFVRDIAAKIESVTETNFDETNRVVSFFNRTAGVRVHINISSRLIRTVLDTRPSEGGRTQYTHPNCTESMLRNILKYGCLTAEGVTVDDDDDDDDDDSDLDRPDEDTLSERSTDLWGVSREDRARRARSRMAKELGVCDGCFSCKTHSTIRTTTGRFPTVIKKPITENDAFQGVCIRCNPDHVPKSVLEAWRNKNRATVRRNLRAVVDQAAYDSILSAPPSDQSASTDYKYSARWHYPSTHHQRTRGNAETQNSANYSSFPFYDHLTLSDSDLQFLYGSDDGSQDENDIFEHSLLEDSAAVLKDGSPPAQIVVKGAGNTAVNGVYKKDGYFDTACRYVRYGKLNGKGCMFYIFRCPKEATTMRDDNNQISSAIRRWCISFLVPEHCCSPGRAASVIDLYTAPAKRDHTRLPPQQGWTKANADADADADADECIKSSSSSAPILFYRRTP